jgi:Fe(II)/alpha-ketoglutarate-dependent arginine beta-hydroxylase
MTPALAPTIHAPRHVLTAGEIDQIQALVSALAARYPSADDPEFLRQVTVFSHELPRELRMALNEFKLCDPPPGYVIVSGYPIDQEKIGKTPTHWQDPAAKATTREEEIALVLIGSLLGDLFGWTTQQGGRLVHEVFPIKGHEHEQLGSSSTELLTWHTEDAFHPCRGDYLVLLCLRNTQRASTTVGTFAAQRLSEAERAQLHAAQFTIRPDESHLPKNRPLAPGEPIPEDVDAGYARIEAMNEQPDAIPVLFGPPEAPYLRLDPYFMNDLDAETPAAAALRSLIAAIEVDMRDVVLEAGDILCLDNFRVVHGRKPFVAAFNGNDRWLKRINITRDLRKSRDVRTAADSRVIGG